MAKGATDPAAAARYERAEKGRILTEFAEVTATKALIVLQEASG